MTASADPAPPLTASGLPERLALLVLQLGAIAVVLAATEHKVFELDRFFVPKELVLHATALLAGIFAIRCIGRAGMSSVDGLLLAYLLFSVASAALATNPWAGMRAAALSISSVVIFWTARGLREAGLARPLLTALAVAGALMAATSLAQAYGLRLEIFSVNRAPGGTLGNRNFVGHAAAFGLPVIFLLLFRARTIPALAAGAFSLALVSASLVLTRSRAAWIAAAAVTGTFLLASIASRALRRDHATWRRLTLMAFVASSAVAAALLIPNTLRWRSDNPYLESVRNVASFDEGSGRGRLIQYERSLRMTFAHPLLGVGPGNWSMRYPEYAIRRDPSMDPSSPGMTYNPWPSSDWIAFVSERGPLAAALMASVLAALALSGVRRTVLANDPLEAMTGTALLGTVIGAAVTGAFDAVLLLPLPALMVWAALGALWSPRAASRTRLAPILLMLLVLAGSAAGVVRSAAQMSAMHTFATAGDRPSLERAARLDPGNYRLRLRLARSGRRAERCRHATALRQLYPGSHAARAAARGCPG